MKGSLLFILGAAVGIIGSFMADSPIDPFHDWIVSQECQDYYAKELNISKEEFASRIEQMKQH